LRSASLALFATGLPLWLAVPFAVIVITAIPAAVHPAMDLQDPMGGTAQINPQLDAFITRVPGAQPPQAALWVLTTADPNAFTFGIIGNARLVVTRGLVMLNPQEVEAVVGHEMGHIAHWDFVVMTVAAVVPLVLYTLWIATQLAARATKAAAILR
jgi:Zn-dependent protease with chaperone function